MRMAMAFLAATAVTALSLASPAMANIDDAANWYKLAGAEDGTSTLYLLDQGSFTRNDRGWAIVPFLTIKAGPGVANSIFAQYRVIYFKCGEGTMGLFSYTNYYRLGTFADTESVDKDDVKFTPIDMTNQFGLAYQIVCGSYDVTTLPMKGTTSVSQLTETAVTAYDAKIGRQYVY